MVIKVNGFFPEELEQVAVMDWLRLQHPKVEQSTFHIANERKCTPQYGRKLQRLGVKRGVSDLFFAWPTAQHAGLFIEMKSKEGKPTNDQKKFVQLMIDRGYDACFCFGAEQAIKKITNYLSDFK